MEDGSERTDQLERDSADGRGDGMVQPSDAGNGNGNGKLHGDKLITSGERRVDSPCPLLLDTRASTSRSLPASVCLGRGCWQLVGSSALRGRKGLECNDLAEASRHHSSAPQRRRVELVPSPNNAIAAAFNKSVEPTVEAEAALFTNTAKAQWGIVRCAHARLGAKSTKNLQRLPPC